MPRIDIDGAIRQHNQWRRQFMNAFAGGDYADMPLSEHRGCQLAGLLRQCPGLADTAGFRMLISEHERFHALANEIIDLSQNGMGDAADLLLPQLTDSSLALVAQLDWLRQHSAD